MQASSQQGATARGLSGPPGLAPMSQNQKLSCVLQVSGLRMEGVGHASYREDLKQVELGGVTLLSVDGHRHSHVSQVLRKQHNEETGPKTEANNHTQLGAGWSAEWSHRGPLGPHMGRVLPSLARLSLPVGSRRWPEWSRGRGGCCHGLLPPRSHLASAHEGQCL